MRPFIAISLLVIICTGIAWGFTDPTLRDDFNRADTSPTPGANWSLTLSPIDTSSMGIVSNVVRRLAPGTSGSIWWNVTTFGPDVAAAVTIPDAAAASGNWVRIYVRMQSPGTSSLDGYFCDFQPMNEIVRVFRVTDLNFFQISGTNPATINNNSKLGCEALGTTITAYVDSGSGWVAAASGTDTTYSAAGFVGLRTADDGNTYSFDDFRAETLVAGGTRRGVPLMAQ